MNLRERMAGEVERLEVAHEQNRVNYRASLQRKNDAERELREANTVAHNSANELAAARNALEELNRHQPVTEVTGEGELQGGDE